MRRSIVALLVVLAIFPAQRGAAQQYDLAIRRASVLDVRTGQVSSNQDILIRDGIIHAIRPTGKTAVRAQRVIDARGNLVTPGFVDTHLHLCNVICSAAQPDSLPLTTDPDSIASLRRRLGALYLPHGVTAVRDAGSDERAMPLLLALMQRSASAPDFYPAGAELISSQGNRLPEPWQVMVGDSAAAAAKVRSYHSQGIRHIKLYWRLREPEFRGALLEAQGLQMNVTGHVDQGVMTIDRALALGLRHFEHVHTLGRSVLSAADIRRLIKHVPRTLGVDPEDFPPTALYMNVPEMFNFLGSNNERLLALLERLRDSNSTVTPTLHVFGQRYGLAFFQSTPRDSTEDTSEWTRKQRERTRAGYRVMASYVKRMYDLGIRLNTGSDAPDPGRSILSEMLLLHESGIPMTAVFRIATLDGAQGIGRGWEFGSIEVGKRAHLILFGGDPLSRPTELLGMKLVIKDGVVASGSVDDVVPAR